MVEHSPKILASEEKKATTTTGSSSRDGHEIQSQLLGTGTAYSELSFPDE